MLCCLQSGRGEQRPVGPALSAGGRARDPGRLRERLRAKAVARGMAVALPGRSSRPRDAARPRERGRYRRAHLAHPVPDLGRRAKARRRAGRRHDDAAGMPWQRRDATARRRVTLGAHLRPASELPERHGPPPLCSLWGRHGRRGPSVVGPEAQPHPPPSCARDPACPRGTGSRRLRCRPAPAADGGRGARRPRSGGGRAGGALGVVRALHTHSRLRLSPLALARAARRPLGDPSCAGRGRAPQRNLGSRNGGGRSTVEPAGSTTFSRPIFLRCVRCCSTASQGSSRKEPDLSTASTSTRDPGPGASSIAPASISVAKMHPLIVRALSPAAGDAPEHPGRGTSHAPTRSRGRA